MKYVIPAWLMEIAHKSASIPFVKSVLNPIYDLYKQRLENKRNSNFHRFSLNALRVFDECLTKNSIPYTLIFGSLLGAIRESGFIKHDLDIDVALFIEDRTPVLHRILDEAGFRLIRRFIIGDGSLGCEETYEFFHSGVTIDIFYICSPIDNYQYCCCWNKAEGCATYRESVKKIGGVYPRRIDQPVNRVMVRAPFENIEVSITANAKECLEFAYGKSYMIPDPDFRPPTDHRYICYDIIAQVEFYDGVI